MPAIDTIPAAALDVFPSELSEAITKSALPGLGEGPVNQELCDLLSEDKRAELLSGVAAGSRSACLSGLWLLAGDIDRSHTISQAIDTSTGSFLHAIMHRREGDYGNSKYWFRKVGQHPVLDEISAQLGDLYPDPFAFVDTCSKAAGGPLARQCQHAQWIEWQLLMAHILAG
jgi:hypothetical protein